MVVRRRAVLLLFEQALKVSLLRGGRLEHHRDVRDLKGRFNQALVESSLGRGVEAARQSHPGRADRSNEPVLLGQQRKG